MATTIKDVARASGLSAATISYVLNNSRAVRPQTHARVMKAVRALDYHPSAVARGLSRKRMDTIGVVFPQTGESPVTDPYYSPILDGICDVATQKRQNTTLFTGEVWNDALHSVPIYRDGRCDGLLLISPHTGSAVVDALAGSSVPFVVISSYGDDERLSRADVDNVAAARQMTEYLLAQGHTRIALVSRTAEAGTYVTQRAQGWQDALEAAGLPAPAALRRDTVPAATGDAREALNALLSLPESERPTALFFTRDRDALNALPLLAERGLRVPQDISVAGFDDTAPSAVSVPSLTTVRQPLRAIGAAAAELLLDRIQDGAAGGVARLLPTEIVVRNSVAPPRRE